MKNLKKALLIALAAYIVPTFALDGNSGGGGNIVICDGRPAVTLDYFDAVLHKDYDGIIDVSTYTSEDAALSVILRQFHGYFNFQKQILKALDVVGYIDDWNEPEGGLRQMNDSNEPYFPPKGCAVKTAAYRENDDPIQMYKDSSAVAQLSPGQRAMLRVHEALYLLAWKNTGTMSSASVRFLLREALKTSAPLSESLWVQIKAMGGDTEGFIGFTLAIMNGQYSMTGHSNVLGLLEHSSVQVSGDEIVRHITLTNPTIAGLPKSAEFDCSDETILKDNISSDVIKCPEVISFADAKKGPWLELEFYPKQNGKITLTLINSGHLFSSDVWTLKYDWAVNHPDKYKANASAK